MCVPEPESYVKTEPEPENDPEPVIERYVRKGEQNVKNNKHFILDEEGINILKFKEAKEKKRWYYRLLIHSHRDQDDPEKKRKMTLLYRIEQLCMNGKKKYCKYLIELILLYGEKLFIRLSDELKKEEHMRIHLRQLVRAKNKYRLHTSFLIEDCYTLPGREHDYIVKDKFSIWKLSGFPIDEIYLFIRLQLLQFAIMIYYESNITHDIAEKIVERLMKKKISLK